MHFLRIPAQAITNSATITAAMQISILSRCCQPHGERIDSNDAFLMRETR